MHGRRYTCIQKYRSEDLTGENKYDLGVHENIRMGLREREWEVVEWMHVAQDRDQKGGRGL